MSRFRVLGLALMALFVVGAALTSVASAALPMILPLEAERAYTGESKEVTTLTVLGKTLAVICKTATGEGVEEKEKPLGTFHIAFKECSATILGIKVTCTGLGDPTGVILALGTYHLVYDTLVPLNSATLFLISPEVHFSCSTALQVVKGNVLCLDVEPTVKKVTHEFKCKTSGVGDPEETKYYNESGTLVAITPLETSENGGAFVDSAQAGNGTVTYKVEVFADV